MKKDLLMKIFRKAECIWREAKKPVLRIDWDGDFTLLPCKKCADETKKPKVSFKINLELTLVYILLALVALRAFIGLIFD